MAALVADGEALASRAITSANANLKPIAVTREATGLEQVNVPPDLADAQVGSDHLYVHRRLGEVQLPNDSGCDRSHAVGIGRALSARPLRLQQGSDHVRD
jgi:hypothetical protein